MMPREERSARHRALIINLMPSIGGREVLKEIRSASPNAATPVVRVSVVSDRETIERCLAAGVRADHLKPVRRAEIVASVQKQLASRRKPSR
jgi:DNA-binding NarL/FixJ family response regulator